MLAHTSGSYGTPPSPESTVAAAAEADSDAVPPPAVPPPFTLGATLPGTLRDRRVLRFHAEFTARSERKVKACCPAVQRKRNHCISWKTLSQGIVENKNLQLQQALDDKIVNTTEGGRE